MTQLPRPSAADIQPDPSLGLVSGLPDFAPSNADHLTTTGILTPGIKDILPQTDSLPNFVDAIPPAGNTIDLKDGRNFGRDALIRVGGFIMSAVAVHSANKLGVPFTGAIDTLKHLTELSSSSTDATRDSAGNLLPLSMGVNSFLGATGTFGIRKKLSARKAMQRHVEQQVASGQVSVPGMSEQRLAKLQKKVAERLAK